MQAHAARLSVESQWPSLDDAGQRAADAVAHDVVMFTSDGQCRAQKSRPMRRNPIRLVELTGSLTCSIRTCIPSAWQDWSRSRSSEIPPFPRVRLDAGQRYVGVASEFR